MPNKRQLSLSSESPIRKKPINLAKLFVNRQTDPNFGKNTIKNSYYKYIFNHRELYQIKKQYDLFHIIKYNANIELHKFSIYDNKIDTNKYNNLDYNYIIQYGQGDSPQIDQFYVSGKNIKNFKEEEFLLTAESLKYLYCNKDLSTLYLFDYKADDENSEPNNNKKEKGKIFKEFLQNNNINLIKRTKELKKLLKEKNLQGYSNSQNSQSSSLIASSTRSSTILSLDRFNS